MVTINQLASTDTLSGGDAIAVYVQNQGDARRASMTTLAAYLGGLPSANGQRVTQYAAPSATGFSVAISDANTWLLLAPTAGFAAGAIALPDTAPDRSEISVSCTQAITSLSVSGGTVTGAPTALAANGFFTMRYDAITKAWYRAG